MLFLKFFLFIALTLSAHLTFSQKFQGDSWADIKNSGSGVMTIIYSEQFGLIHKDKDGKMKGVCVDILTDFTKYLKEKYGKTLTIKYAAEIPVFSEFLLTAQNTPSILGVTNTTITDERKKTLKFSPPYMSNRQVMLTSNKAPSITSLKELPTKFSGFTAQVIAGSTHVQYVEKIKTDYMPALTIAQEVSGPAIIKNLMNNPKLFTIIDFTEFVDVVYKKLPIKRQMVDVGVVEELGFIMSKQTDWDVPLKEFLTPEYRSSVGYRKIISENLGATFMSLVK
ncbi:transporter substrate-binding domain-containing protein [Chryseolinea sp. H1M3-3]|uniref:substrate-binding periplasmic protein n=1 Tax=Chryseolinea sp. H1M3-3 TaxID=3034144 RepID=UPI0023EBB9A1|nr:transporter substrate-binding domain-containing protein [Chryseolinea sp. H1M3-3]